MKTLKSIVIFLGFFIGTLGFASAATIILTNSSDTLNTFRTNVNTSLTNLNNALGAGFPFTSLNTGENATSTTLAFLNGFLSTASSTLASTTASSLLVTGSASTTNFFTGNLLTNGSSTIQSLFFPSGTSTNLYVTNLNVAGSSTLQTTSLTAIRNLGTNGFVKTSGGTGALSVDTNTYLTSMTFAWPWTKLSSNEQATSTTIAFLNGFISMASSTASSLVATSTNLNVSANHISFGSNYVSATTTAFFRVASTTLDAIGKDFQIATGTYQIGTYPERRIIQSVLCNASTTGSVVFRIGDGTNWTVADKCGTSVKQTVYSSNNSFAPFTKIIMEVGSAATSPNDANFTLVENKVSD